MLRCYLSIILLSITLSCSDRNRQQRVYVEQPIYVEPEPVVVPVHSNPIVVHHYGTPRVNNTTVIVNKNVVVNSTQKNNNAYKKPYSRIESKKSINNYQRTNSLTKGYNTNSSAKTSYSKVSRYSKSKSKTTSINGISKK